MFPTGAHVCRKGLGAALQEGEKVIADMGYQASRGPQMLQS